MKRTIHMLLLTLVLFTTACSDNKANPLTAIAEDGTRYTILDQRVIRFQGGYMFLLKYLSKDHTNTTVTAKEFADFYGIIATNTDPTSQLNYIGVEAIDESSSRNLVWMMKGVRDYKTFDEVMKLRPEEMKHSTKTLMKWPPE